MQFQRMYEIKFCENNEGFQRTFQLKTIHCNSDFISNKNKTAAKIDGFKKLTAEKQNYFRCVFFELSAQTNNVLDIIYCKRGKQILKRAERHISVHPDDK